MAKVLEEVLYELTAAGTVADSHGIPFSFLLRITAKKPVGAKVEKVNEVETAIFIFPIHVPI